MITVIQNVQVITPFAMHDGVVVIRDGTIAQVCTHFDPPEDAAVYDGQGLYLSPGLIDLHVHGGGGRSAMEGTADAIRAMADAHAWYGTTAMLPTTLSMDEASLLRAAQSIVDVMRQDGGNAAILGIHFEGPFLSPQQAGAQAVNALRIPTQANIAPLLDFLPHVRMMGVAPELEGAMDLGDLLAAHGVVASVAHSDADYDTVAAAALHGYADVTHLYSGCSTVVRKNAFRVPGVVEAGLNLDALTVQVIADGCHLPLPLLQLIYRCKGVEGMYAITDGLEFAASAMQEGDTYQQRNGQPVLYEDGVMKLPDRSAFAGSAITMNKAVHTLHAAGIPLIHAVRMATDVPATRIGAGTKGRVAEGYDADLMLHDEAMNPRLCMRGGRVYRNEGIPCRLPPRNA